MTEIAPNLCPTVMKPNLGCYPRVDNNCSAGLNHERPTKSDRGSDS
jgi:hypothetical protein